VHSAWKPAHPGPSHLLPRVSAPPWLRSPAPASRRHGGSHRRNSGHEGIRAAPRASPVAPSLTSPRSPPPPLPLFHRTRVLPWPGRRSRRSQPPPRARQWCLASSSSTTTSSRTPSRSKRPPEAADRATSLRSGAGDPLQPPACSEPSPSRLLNGDHRCKRATLPDILLFPLSHRS
jgi:hypothetical protein